MNAPHSMGPALEGRARQGAEAGVSRPPRLDLDAGLMVFNWLPGLYAHRDWLGPWGPLLEPRERAGRRIVQGASRMLIDKHGLQGRHLRELGRHAWLLVRNDVLRRIAERLGTAMLGGWVRNRLERQAVRLQLQVLGEAGRRQALADAGTLRALPFFNLEPGTWPPAQDPARTCMLLGTCCLATLLDDPDSGALQRFLLRFPLAAVTPLALSAPQREEAHQLIDSVLAESQGAAA